VSFRILAYLSAAVSITLAQRYPHVPPLPVSNESAANRSAPASNVILGPSRRQRPRPFARNSSDDEAARSAATELDDLSLSPTLVEDPNKNSR
jgi:hypothetical protein